jgi:SAM-dependent methyltransferase
VVATDQSSVMLALLQKRARQEGLKIETCVMDGHALEFDDDSFDMAGSQFGVMLFPDAANGLREMARVVRPQGRVLMTVYGDPHRIDFLKFFVAAVQSVRPDFNGPPLDPPPLPFQLQDPRKLRDELAAARLHSIAVEEVIESTRFNSAHDLWEWIVWSNPIVNEMLDGMSLSNDDRAVVQATLHKMFRERAGDDGAAQLTNPVNIGIGTK